MITFNTINAINAMNAINHMNIYDLITAFTGLIMPQECPACGIRLCDDTMPLCPKCVKILSNERAPGISATTFIGEIWSLRAYEGLIRICIKELKYRHNIGMEKVFSLLIHESTYINSGFSEKPDLVIAVPLSRSRYRERGFNQSEIIGHSISKALAIPFITNTLIKVKDTPDQIGLSRNDRLKNLKGSFAVKNASVIEKKSILLVDDVITTGATLDSSAEELLKNGAKHICGFTLARTL